MTLENLFMAMLILQLGLIYEMVRLRTKIERIENDKI